MLKANYGYEKESKKQVCMVTQENQDNSVKTRHKGEYEGIVTYTDHELHVAKTWCFRIKRRIHYKV